ncbi:hypothetical protein Syun_025707 [Stephania yunnanensis]|uniref:Uncharacterized protein n=1 Tax=Stephania yunnanensis TaxID=152371 RepID=A0AAP0EV34_9MAGN
MTLRSFARLVNPMLSDPQYRGKYKLCKVNRTCSVRSLKLEKKRGSNRLRPTRSSPDIIRRKFICPRYIRRPGRLMMGSGMLRWSNVPLQPPFPLRVPIGENVQVDEAADSTVAAVLVLVVRLRVTISLPDVTGYLEGFGESLGRALQAH